MLRRSQHTEEKGVYIKSKMERSLRQLICVKEDSRILLLLLLVDGRNDWFIGRIKREKEKKKRLRRLDWLYMVILGNEEFNTVILRT